MRASSGVCVFPEFCAPDGIYQCWVLGRNKPWYCTEKSQMWLQLIFFSVPPQDPHGSHIYFAFACGFGLPRLCHFPLDVEEYRFAGFFPGLFLTHLFMMTSRSRQFSSIPHRGSFKPSRHVINNEQTPGATASMLVLRPVIWHGGDLDPVPGGFLPGSRRSGRRPRNKRQTGRPDRKRIRIVNLRSARCGSVLDRL